MWIDAFTQERFRGNPAAIVTLETWLPEPLMQSIAAEMNLSETAFVVPTSGNGWHIRWFTPTLEVDLVGHATLAAASALFERLDPRHTEIRFTSRSGPLLVRRNGELIEMDFPTRLPVPCAAPPGLAGALGVTPIETFVAQHYLAVFKSEDEVRALAPNMNLIAALDRAAVIVTAPGGPGDFVSRFFAPANGVPEDPVSGVAHCTLIPYWSRRLGTSRLRAHQVSRRGGDLVCEERGERVIIAGHCALIFRAELSL